MSTPDIHGKKVPQFSSFKLVPAPQKADDCCCEGSCFTTPIVSNAVIGIRYSWKVADMDYAACARKVENTVRQVSGVNQVQVLFATKELVVDASSDIRQQVESAVQKAGYTLRDEHATDAAPESRFKENLPLTSLIITVVISWGLEQFNHPFGQIAFIATTLVGLYPITRQVLCLMKTSSYFAIETLIDVAAIGALFISTTAGAAMVPLLFLIGERLGGWAASCARKGVSALMVLKPETAARLHNGEREEVAINTLWPGDAIEVAAGGRLPVDGKLVSGFTSFDESALAGESIPVERATGGKVPTGTTSVDRLVVLEVLSEPGASATDRILKLIEEAEERCAPIERFIDRFSRTYTPTIIAVALLATLVPLLLFAVSWQEWIYKGLTPPLIDCPCALVISTPAAITSGLAAAARRGALIKDGAALEQSGRVTQVTFDKIDTLTVGKPCVMATHPASGIGETELLALAAAVEQDATHSLAQTIVRGAQTRELTIPIAKERRALVGSGIEALVNGEHVLIFVAGKQPTDAFAGQINELGSAGRTVALVLRNDTVLGILVLQDTLRDDARSAISELNQIGVKGMILTGDNPRAAAAIAGELGLEFKAGFLPKDKVQVVTYPNQQSPLAMVSDGINDAPAMKAAAIGIAMGSGTDVALETADATLTHNRLRGLVQMTQLVRVVHANIHQNIAIALGLKGIFLVTTLLGITGLWLAVLAGTGATVLVTANALRLSRRGQCLFLA